MGLEETVIQVENASVRFTITSENIDNIKEYFIKLVKRKLRFREFYALKNVCLEIKKGESWGIIGRNGAGKTTLLRTICGILAPHTGSVKVSGTISPMMELGSGFDPELTAVENIYLEGALLGRSKEYMRTHYDEVIEFSELAGFLDMPIKNYSSGMKARLAFAIATVVKPEILIVDEVLSVGDAAFKRKCEERMREMLQGNVTLLLVSHSSGAIEGMCEKALWLRDGEVVMAGNAKEVCAAYEDYYK